MLSCSELASVFDAKDDQGRSEERNCSGDGGVPRGSGKQEQVTREVVYTHGPCR